MATATTLAVSLVPTFFGRSLVGPVVDRFPYKWVLIWSHLVRAACVLGLMWLAMTGSALWVMFLVLFALELVGGASTASNIVLLTDLFEDRHLYARAVGLGAMSEQFNQALGLAVGGGLVALVGPETGLLFDLLTSSWPRWSSSSSCHCGPSPVSAAAVCAASSTTSRPQPVTWPVTRCWRGW